MSGLVIFAIDEIPTGLEDVTGSVQRETESFMVLRIGNIRLL